MLSVELVREYHSADRRACVTLLQLPAGAIHVFRYEILGADSEREYSTPIWLGSFETLDQAERLAAAELNAPAAVAG